MRICARYIIVATCAESAPCSGIMRQFPLNRSRGSHVFALPLPRARELTRARGQLGIILEKPQQKTVSGESSSSDLFVDKINALLVRQSAASHQLAGRAVH